MPNLTALTLSNNNLNGSIPNTLGRTNLFILNLAHNKLSGDASFLFDKANTAQIDIRVEYNLLKFEFSNVDLARNLVGFNISHNMIYGSLPKRLGQLHVDSIDGLTPMASSSSHSSCDGPRRCFCGIPVIVLKSWTEANPGRKFQTCMLSKRGSRDDGCNFFCWVDKPQTDWQKDVINGLLKEVKCLKNEMKKQKDIDEEATN
ncbi:hypothetical protein KSS87_010369 [Heliosperma pusillum]|nr:hypothetical protein KSS87_010369 [Heliosperma pusillum]